MKNKGSSSRRQRFPLDAILLDRTDGLLHRQLYGQLRAAILKRMLRPEMALPSTRALARDLRVSRNTVIAAYDQLASEGYIETRPGSRSCVAALVATPEPGRSPNRLDTPAERISARGRLMLDEPRQRSLPGRAAFHPGTPDIRHFPFGELRRLLGRRMQALGDDLFGYHHLTGYPPLKEAIALYLDASRGVRCEPDQVVVTTGAQGALDLLARLLLDPGDQTWMEEPGYLGAQSAFLSAGASLHPLAVNAAGWVLEPPDAVRLRLFYTTPSCQFPLGATMRIEQRLRLLEIAHQHDAWILEDDFDSEYRFAGAPIPAMQGADPTGRTIYIGTFAKTLFPALRIGFMILPPCLSERVNKAINISAQYPPLVLQAALADFMNQGTFARHLRRMRRLYGRRRELFMEIGRHYLSDWLDPAPGDAGIQTLWWLMWPLQDQAVAAAAGRREINVAPLSQHYRHGNPRQGLVLGYAALDEEMMHAGLRELREVLESLAQS